jgi:hypothetical protein
MDYIFMFIKELRVIINHYNKFSLNTQKQANYLLFQENFKIIEQKDPLTEKGLKKNNRFKIKNG